MAEGDTNLTNVVASGTMTAGTGLTVTSGGATVTAGGLTVTAGGATVSAGGASITGAITSTTDITATRSLTGAALYGPTIAAGNPTVAGFTVDGTNPPTMGYIRVYDTGYNAFRNYRFWNGILTAT